MNCPNCGTSNLDNATLCINCGRPMTAAASPPRPVTQSYTPPPPPPNTFMDPTPRPGPGGQPLPPPAGAPVFYLVAAILTFFCCCNPFAVVSLVFAINTMSRRSAGDYIGMARNARLTAIWFWVAAITSIVGWGLVLTIGGWDAIEEIRRNLPR